MVQKVRELCRQVFLQLGRRYDSSARTLAADILLTAGVSKDELREMLWSMSHFITKDSQEVGQYTLQRLRQVAERDLQLLATYKSVLADEQTRLNNYHVLGQRGMATAFSRNFLDTASSNGSLVSTLELAGGILKRSVLDVVIEGADQSQALFTVSDLFFYKILQILVIFRCKNKYKQVPIISFANIIKLYLVDL